jgi:hypothetical protein
MSEVSNERIQEVEFSGVIFEHFFTTGAVSRARIVEAGLPEGSRLIDASVEDFGHTMAFRFLLPEGHAATKGRISIVYASRDAEIYAGNEKVYKIQRADGLFSQGGLYAACGGPYRWSRLGKLWASLRNLMAHLALFRAAEIPDDWQAVEYALVEVGRRPAIDLKLKR